MSCSTYLFNVAIILWLAILSSFCKPSLGILAFHTKYVHTTHYYTLCGVLLVQCCTTLCTLKYNNILLLMNSLGQYFASSWSASWGSPTRGDLRASTMFLQVVGSGCCSSALSVSLRQTSGSEYWRWMSFTLFWSPRSIPAYGSDLYRCFHDRGVMEFW